MSLLLDLLSWWAVLEEKMVWNKELIALLLFFTVSLEAFLVINSAPGRVADLMIFQLNAKLGELIEFLLLWFVLLILLNSWK